MASGLDIGEPLTDGSVDIIAIPYRLPLKHEFVKRDLGAAVAHTL
jgi:hypothetical protein